MADNLQEKRKEIDELDRSLVKLLHKRADLAREVGRIKQEDGYSALAPVREAEILSAVSTSESGSFPKAGLRAVFREIISSCRNMEKDGRVGILGEKYGWVNDAARRRFGAAAELMAMGHADEIIRAIARHEIGYAFFALNAGHPDLPLLLEEFIGRRLFIVAETHYRRAFSLISRGTAEQSQIEEIFVTAEVLSWLRRWAASLSFPVRISVCRSMEEVFDNIVEGRKVAGIVPMEFAKSIDAHIIQTGLTPVEELPVRCFTVSAKRYAGPLEKDMIVSVLLSVPDLPGSLLAALAPIRDAKLNVAAVETFRFHGKAWDNLFWVDFSAPTDSSSLDAVLKAVETKCRLFSFLGVYPVIE
ncbi:MAG: chorismate mutase [Candidatus Riflebacteria bacterium]|nr:chorismate mutase [Candidatus Riflebacteria bacterium]